MSKWITALLTSTLLPLAASQSSTAGDARPVNVSEYTKLTHPPCKTARMDREGGNSEQNCPAPLGHRLLLLDSDGRMSVTIVTPDAANHPLEFSKTVTPHFSSLGNRAEWRIQGHGLKRVVLGVILPLDVKEDPDSNKVTPYWVVAKISGQNVCVVQTLKRTENSLAKARQAADSAVNAKCRADAEPEH